MSERTDKELLHAAIDGSLSEAESARLDELTAHDAAARTALERLRQLQQALSQAGPVEPPPDFADRVMAAVSARERQAAGPRSVPVSELGKAARQLWRRVACHLFGATAENEGYGGAGFSGGGAIVAKKTLWAFAGVAVAAILVFVYFNGSRSVDQGVEGTIAGANRAVGTQPASVDAPTGDIQAFLQSDAFNRIIKNKELRNLLSDPAACAILANPAVEAAMQDADVRTALQDETVMAAVRDSRVQALLAADSVQTALADPDAQATLKRADLQSVLKLKPVEAALTDQAARAALADAEVVAALGDAKIFAQLQAEAQLAVKQAGLREGSRLKETVALGTNTRLAAAMHNAAFLQFVALTPVAQLKPFLNLVSVASIRSSLLKDDAMANLITNDAVQAAMHGDKGMAQLFGDAEFVAALRGSQSALAQAAQMQGQAAINRQVNVQAQAALNSGANLNGARLNWQANLNGKTVALNGFAALISNAAIQQALQNGSLQALLAQSGAQAALKNYNALSAALQAQQ